MDETTPPTEAEYTEAERVGCGLDCSPMKVRAGMCDHFPRRDLGVAPVDCRLCDGIGRLPCDGCDGEGGDVVLGGSTPDSITESHRPCGACGGSGEGAACPLCEALAEVRRLRRLLWCARQVRSIDALRLVEPAAVETLLRARGWREIVALRTAHSAEYALPPAAPGLYRPGVTVSLEPTWRDYHMRVAEVVRDVAPYLGVLEFEALAAMLPARGPWHVEVPRG